MDGSKYKTGTKREAELSASRLVLVFVLPIMLATGLCAVPLGYSHQTEPTGPQIWHVSVGGESKDGSIQGEAFYPHVLTIGVGDTVVWTLSSGEPHSITFFGTEPIPQDCLIASDFSPCPVPLPSPYDGSSFAGSGLMLPPGFNWDNNFPLPHGNDTFTLTFGKPGVYVYQSVVQIGMQGVVIVQPTGTPYPFLQKDYAVQAKQQLNADLNAARRVVSSSKPPDDIWGPDGTEIHTVVGGTGTP